MRSLFKLKKFFLKYKYKLALGILFTIFSNVANVYVPIFLKRAIDNLQEKINYDVIIDYALLIVAASLIGGVFRFLIRQTIIVVSREIEYDLRQDFWGHIQKLPMRYFQNNSTGNIMAHATNDISAVRMFVGPAVMYSVDTITRFVIIIAIMLTYSPSVTLYALLPLPFLSYVVYRLGQKIHEKFTFIQEQFSVLTAKAQESFAGIRVVKSYVREQNEIKEFNDISSDYLDKNMDMVKIRALFMPALYMITGLSIIIVVWIGGIKVINGEMTLGEISAFMVYLGMLIWPIIAFGWIVNIIQQASASMKRLNKMFDEKYEIEDAPDALTEKKELKGDVCFRNVSFRYGDHLPYVLKDINLEIKAGQTVAIVGHTGVGKTSLINLIPRLYDVSEGEVLIDGYDIKKIPLETLRKNIGLASQETFLFSDTIANNISYGIGENKFSEVERVAEISQLKKDVEGFPLKYDTILGERGITLSGGQKQRTSLSRALAIDPKILILDDTFSAVDTSTEEEILKKLKEFMKDRTSVIISHRISTVKDADFIIVIDKARIAEKGTHDELVELGGIYADLHYKQLLEKELEELK